MQIIEIKPDYRRILISFSPRSDLSSLTMSHLFKDFQNLLETGMSLTQAVVILKETSQDAALTRILSMIESQLLHGHSLTVIFSQLKSFPWIVSVTLSAGEKAGRLTYALGILGAYFEQSYLVRNKLKQALIYPSIVFVILIALMLFVSLHIVPQLKNLLPDHALGNHLTRVILALSEFIQRYILVTLLLVPLLFFGLIYFFKKRFLDCQQWLYQWPIIGDILKESALALYLLNLSVLLKSGVPLLSAITDLNILNQTLVAKRFEKVCDYILGGSSFWESIEQDPFFPKVISSTLRRAEEMTKLEEYCFSLSEYFQKKLNNRIDRLIQMIQPLLLGIGGMFLVVIAIAFLFPIYGNLTNIAGG
jgi:type IV pilus assembly protein PilC